MKLTHIHREHLLSSDVEDIELGEHDAVAVRMVKGACRLTDDAGEHTYFCRGRMITHDDSTSYCPWSVAFGDDYQTLSEAVAHINGSIR